MIARGDIQTPEAVVTRESAGYHRAFERLCHLVPLNRSGMVQEVVDSLILTSFGIDPADILGSPASVVSALDAYFGVELNASDAQASLERLVLSGRLQRVGGDRLVLSPAAEAEVQTRISHGHRLEEDVRNEWADRLIEMGRTDEEVSLLWSCLRGYMARAFCQHGALTVQLLDPGAVLASDELVSLRNLLDASIAENAPGLDPEIARRSVSAFFESSSPSRARYVAQMLDATFTFFALRVDEATSRYLRGSLSPLKLFLDTNFIFGLLDLGDNPLRDVCKELLTLINAQGFPFTLHYHERTLKELRDTIDHAGSMLRGRRWSPALSRAACTYPLSGLEQAYHRLNAVSPVDVDVFLSKFDHIEDLLMGFGVKLYRPSPQMEASAEEKGLLVAEYLEYARENRPNRPKPYESAEHDMAVLLTLDHLRHRGAALDVGALFLSVDFLLWKFDHSQFRGRVDVGRVVLPSHLMQLLRPFSDSDDDFDQRFVEAFAVPEFRVAHGDYGETASMVLSYLATYQDVPEKTAVRLLADELLLGHLKGVDAGAVEFAEIIDRALDEDHVHLARENEVLKAELDGEREAKRLAMADAEQGRADKAQELARVAADHDAVVAAVREEERARSDERVREVEVGETAKRESLEGEVASLRDQLGGKQRRRRIGIRTAAAGSWVLVTVLAIVLPHVFGWHWLLRHNHLPGIYLAFCSGTGGALWAIAHRPHRKVMLGVVVPGAVLALIGVL